MNNKFKIFCLTLFILASASNARAQETIFSDLSYPYLEKLIATAKKNYPEVEIRKLQTNIAKSTFHQSSFGWLDAFSASYIYTPQSTINLTSPTIFQGYQLVASVSLGSLFSRPYTIHNAREAAKVAEFQQKEYELTLEKQVTTYYIQYLGAQAELRSRVKAVNDATTSVKALKYTFDKNEISYEVYNQSLTNLYNQESFRIQAEVALFTAKTNLEELLGAKLESVK
jgi:outer membrane protein TolC